jgi:hypothetical protein
LDINEGGEAILSRYDEDIIEGDDCTVLLNGNINDMEDQIHMRPTGDRRRNLTVMLEHIGIPRPNKVVVINYL